MEVKRVGFVGIRTGRTEETASFFRDVLGLEVVRDDPTWSILQLPTGRHDFLEVYDATFDDDRLAPPGEGVYVAFNVGDVAAAYEEVVAAGIDVGALVWAAEVFDNESLDGYGWFFIHGPDGNVYVIQQTPD